MRIFFYNIATGKTKECKESTDWLNHLQFSPTDPRLLMFCHEGPWHNVDRIWTIRTDGTEFNDSPAHDGDGNRGPRILERPTARPSGTTCRRRAAKISGWRAIT